MSLLEKLIDWRDHLVKKNESSMHRRLRRWFILPVAAAIILPILWAVVSIAATTCGAFDDTVSVTINGGRDVLTLSRRPIWHPILTNEYQRHLTVRQAGIDTWRADLPEGTGGGASLRLFTASPTVLVLADQFDCYLLDIDRQSLWEVSTIREPGLQLVGTFDEDPQTGREGFIPSKSTRSLANAAMPDCGKSL
jgi:hypothetical protein